MKKLEHIGIAVRDLAAATELFGSLLGTQPYKEEVVEREGVRTVFFKVGEVKIELLGALDDRSPIHIFLEHHGQGVHHLAFHTDDIRKEGADLAAKGFRFTADQPSD
ncbi:MAG: VOC family protein, partial [Bacteroidota bacterium]